MKNVFITAENQVKEKGLLHTYTSQKFLFNFQLYQTSYIYPVT